MDDYLAELFATPDTIPSPVAITVWIPEAVWAEAVLLFVFSLLSDEDTWYAGGASTIAETAQAFMDCFQLTVDGL